jgi:nicotinamide mononucleotide adenylyltransferase
MFITELFESQQRHILVAYPGRFQPFHLGHLAVLRQQQATFGADNVRVVTTPNTVQDKIASGATHDKKSIPKNPFNASEKIQLIKAAGVNDHQILLVNDVYSPEAILKAWGADPANTVLILAVGEPDKERLEVDSVYKQFTPKPDKFGNPRPASIPQGKAVGDPKPYKTFPGVKKISECVPVGQFLPGGGISGQAYVEVVAEKQVPFEINGHTVDISHGTQCRATWNMVRNDAKARNAFLKTLYGRATPELVHIFNKIAPDTGAEPVAGTPPAKTATKLPAPAEPAGGMEVKKSAKRANPLVKEAVLPTDTPPGTAPQTATAPQAQATTTPQAKQASQALLKGLEKYQQLYPSLDHNFITGVIDHIEPDGTVVVAGENSTQKLKALLVQGGGAHFRVVNQAQLQIAQQRSQVRTMQEMGGVGVVKGGNDPRYVMATAGDQNDVTGKTLGQEMHDLHLAEVDDFDTTAAKMKKNLVDMVDMRIYSIQQMIKDDPDAAKAFAPKLKELEQKKLEIIIGRKLGAM